MTYSYSVQTAMVTALDATPFGVPTMSDFIKAAFSQVCKEARRARGFYVSLMENCPYYGGPEEGGWWGSDERVLAYQYFSTEEEAEAARLEVLKLAKQLQAEARRDYGEQCLREMAWLEARGLDADYLPEPDGPSTYSVLVTEGLPEEHYGPRHYE